MSKNFDLFLNNMRTSIKSFDFFVNWNKVNTNIENLEYELNILNILLHKKDYKKYLKIIWDNNRKSLEILPFFIALKEYNINILYEHNYYYYDFKNLSDFEKLVLFYEKTGLKNLFLNGNISDLYSYLYGVEVGLDSNGRKNRGGLIMEKLVEIYIKDFVNNNKLSYLSQANFDKIKNEYNIEVPLDYSKRRYDFVIKSNNNIYLIETNFYNSGGSKLKSVAGEFKELNTYLKNYDNIKFIWITDGLNGWKTTKLPLKSAYLQIENMYNIKDLENDIFKQIVV